MNRCLTASQRRGERPLLGHCSHRAQPRPAATMGRKGPVSNRCGAVQLIRAFRQLVQSLVVLKLSVTVPSVLTKLTLLGVMTPPSMIDSYVDQISWLPRPVSTFTRG